MTSAVFFKSYPPPPVNKKEILRYTGVRGDAPEISSLVDECILEAVARLDYRICFTEFPVNVSDSASDLGFAVLSSETLRKNLAGCDRVLLFAATVGLEADRLVARYASIAPSRALVHQAIGAERIESLCDVFCDEIKNDAKKKGLFVRPRISPGYGDIPISLQKEIFNVLDCPKRIGLLLNESLLMSPTKSVTALVGIGRQEGQVISP